MIKIYGADWCSDCTRIKFLLDTKDIEYEYINIDTDDMAKEFVVEANPNGFQSIPVVLFDSKKILIEPSTSEFIKALEKERL